MVTIPGYSGFRPGEKADPYVPTKIGKAPYVPWQGDAKSSSMATRIAQRRLDKAK